MPFYSMDAMIPFSHVVEAPGIGKNCTYHLRTDLEQLSTTMIDSDEIEVKIVMNLNALVLKQTDTGIIREIEERAGQGEAPEHARNCGLSGTAPGYTLGHRQEILHDDRNHCAAQ